MKDLLLYLANAIVENPDKVSVEETTDETGLITYLISVDPEDMGRIIGKEGKTIGAIRSLVRIAARKQDKRVKIDLKEPEGNDRRQVESQQLENQPVEVTEEPKPTAKKTTKKKGKE